MTAVPALDESVIPALATWTVNVYVAVAELVEFVPVIVNLVAAVTPVGVPVIRPVDVSNVNPAGSCGEIVKLAIAPPVDVME
jgi:hypothetical protein